ncbi:MAG: LuxR family transcriptional regulator [Gammaproteobacteria bacterium]|nr:LuxR family transcriptional regulator [Gammaproteobacteria bacterium]
MEFVLTFEKLESLLQADTLDGLHQEIKKLVATLGFDKFIYGFRAHLANSRPFQFVLSGYSKQWWEHYNAAGYIDIDPIVSGCLVQPRILPMRWSDQLFDTPARRALWEDAKSHGLRTGVSFPLRGMPGETAVLSVASSISHKKANDELTPAIAGAQVLAGYVHEAVRRLVFAQQNIMVTHDKLTVRETECLTWAASGKTAWETAAILRLSERTIVFHLANATKKLQATNRRQAVARAIHMGLIRP